MRGRGKKKRAWENRKHRSTPHVPVPPTITSYTVCCFCKQGEDPELGTFFQSIDAELAAHQFCLLFSSGLPQAGSDQDGFEGFLFPDIFKEIRRVRRIVCRFCLNYGASSGCFVKSCPFTYHYKCGLQNDAQFDFYGTFNTYCYAHRSFQDKSYILNGSNLPVCPICLDDIDGNNLSIIKMPCCINVFAHKDCIQNQAMASGYFFRCPTCKNEKHFKREMARYGIYIPQRDAAWEENNAFSDLLQHYQSCDLPTCKCPMGQNFEEENGKWELIRCYHCGQGAVHRQCLGKRYISVYGYVCRDCDQVTGLQKGFTFSPKKSKEQTLEQKRLIQEHIAKGDPLVSQLILTPEKISKKFNIKPCQVEITRLPEKLIWQLENQDSDDSDSDGCHPQGDTGTGTKHESVYGPTSIDRVAKSIIHSTFPVVGNSNCNASESDEELPLPKSSVIAGNCNASQSDEDLPLSKSSVIAGNSKVSISNERKISKPVKVQGKPKKNVRSIIRCQNLNKWAIPLDKGTDSVNVKSDINDHHIQLDILNEGNVLNDNINEKYVPEEFDDVKITYPSNATEISATKKESCTSKDDTSLCEVEENLALESLEDNVTNCDVMVTNPSIDTVNQRDAIEVKDEGKCSQIAENVNVDYSSSKSNVCQQSENNIEFYSSKMYTLPFEEKECAIKASGFNDEKCNATDNSLPSEKYVCSPFNILDPRDAINDKDGGSSEINVIPSSESKNRRRSKKKRKSRKTKNASLSIERGEKCAIQKSKDNIVIHAVNNPDQVNSICNDVDDGKHVQFTDINSLPESNAAGEILEGQSECLRSEGEVLSNEGNGMLETYQDEIIKKNDTERDDIAGEPSNTDVLSVSTKNEIPKEECKSHESGNVSLSKERCADRGGTISDDKKDSDTHRKPKKNSKSRNSKYGISSEKVNKKCVVGEEDEKSADCHVGIDIINIATDEQTPPTNIAILPETKISFGSRKNDGEKREENLAISSTLDKATVDRCPTFTEDRLVFNMPGETITKTTMLSEAYRENGNQTDVRNKIKTLGEIADTNKRKKEKGHIALKDAPVKNIVHHPAENGIRKKPVLVISDVFKKIKTEVEEFVDITDGEPRNTPKLISGNESEKSRMFTRRTVKTHNANEGNNVNSNSCNSNVVQPVENKCLTESEALILTDSAHARIKVKVKDMETKNIINATKPVSQTDSINGYRTPRRNRKSKTTLTSDRTDVVNAKRDTKTKHVETVIGNLHRSVPGDPMLLDCSVVKIKNEPIEIPTTSTPIVRTRCKEVRNRRQPKKDLISVEIDRINVMEHMKKAETMMDVLKFDSSVCHTPSRSPKNTSSNSSSSSLVLSINGDETIIVEQEQVIDIVDETNTSSKGGVRNRTKNPVIDRRVTKDERNAKETLQFINDEHFDLNGGKINKILKGANSAICVDLKPKINIRRKTCRNGRNDQKAKSLTSPENGVISNENVENGKINNNNSQEAATSSLITLDHASPLEYPGILKPLLHKTNQNKNNDKDNDDKNAKYDPRSKITFYACGNVTSCIENNNYNNNNISNRLKRKRKKVDSKNSSLDSWLQKAQATADIFEEDDDFQTNSSKIRRIVSSSHRIKSSKAKNNISSLRTEEVYNHSIPASQSASERSENSICPCVVYTKCRQRNTNK